MQDIKRKVALVGISLQDYATIMIFLGSLSNISSIAFPCQFPFGMYIERSCGSFSDKWVLMTVAFIMKFSVECSFGYSVNY